jgi:hypothetical protein
MVPQIYGISLSQINAIGAARALAIHSHQQESLNRQLSTPVCYINLTKTVPGFVEAPRIGMPARV